jgi:hypothetical protein
MRRNVGIAAAAVAAGGIIAAVVMWPAREAQTPVAPAATPAATAAAAAAPAPANPAPAPGLPHADPAPAPTPAGVEAPPAGRAAQERLLLRRPATANRFAVKPSVSVVPGAQFPAHRTPLPAQPADDTRPVRRPMFPH